jgi:hypothetical protein
MSECQENPPKKTAQPATQKFVLPFFRFECYLIGPSSYCTGVPGVPVQLVPSR